MLRIPIPGLIGSKPVRRERLGLNEERLMRRLIRTVGRPSLRDTTERWAAAALRDPGNLDPWPRWWIDDACSGTGVIYLGRGREPPSPSWLGCRYRRHA